MAEGRGNRKMEGRIGSIICRLQVPWIGQMCFQVLYMRSQRLFAGSTQSMVGRPWFWRDLSRSCGPLRLLLLASVQWLTPSGFKSAHLSQPFSCSPTSRCRTTCPLLQQTHGLGMLRRPTRLDPLRPAAAQVCTVQRLWRRPVECAVCRRRLPVWQPSVCPEELHSCGARNCRCQPRAGGDGAAGGEEGGKGPGRRKQRTCVMPQQPRTP
eukprot:55149-Chlamydomonas_euryale.AAC.10